MATLYHWDTPLALERGGWLNRDTALRFGDYAHAVGEAFGDRIDAWLTLNEPATVTLGGYALGTHAPGERMLFGALPAAHHQLLAHGLAVQALRAADVRGRIGIANAHTPVQAASDRESDGVFAELYDVLHNRVFADPVLLGRYPAPPEQFTTELRALVEVDDDDLRTIHQPLDFYGLNYRGPSRVAAGPGAPAVAGGPPSAAAHLPFHLERFRDHPETGSGLPIAPEYLGVSLAELRGRYGDPCRPSTSPTAARASPTSSTNAARCTTRPASTTSPSTSPPRWMPCGPAESRMASSCAATSSGRCSTDSSGRPGTRSATDSCTSPGTTRPAPPSPPTAGCSACSPPAESLRR